MRIDLRLLSPLADQRHRGRKVIYRRLVIGNFAGTHRAETCRKFSEETLRRCWCPAGPVLGQEGRATLRGQTLRYVEAFAFDPDEGTPANRQDNHDLAGAPAIHRLDGIDCRA